MGRESNRRYAVGVVVVRREGWGGVGWGGGKRGGEGQEGEREREE